MEKVTLFHLKSDRIEITTLLSFTEKGQLFLDGYDIGKRVEEAWGDSDYEYNVTIEPAEVEKIYPLFDIVEGDKQGLLTAIQQQFHGNFAYSNFRTFLEEKKVAYSSFTWS